MSKNYRANRRREPDIRQIDKQGWKSLLHVVITVVVTCVIAIGIPYGIYMYYRHLAATDYFLPRQITIQGNVRVNDASILEASGLQADGANLFEMDVHTIQGSIEMLPWIKDARVEIELPDKVSIEITEYEPLGIVHDGQMHVVDKSGAYIKHWQTEDTVMVPIVSLDKPLSVRTTVIVEAFELAERITRRGYPHKIDEIHYDDATGYTVFTAQSEIRMGYDRFDERIDRLMIVDQHLSQRDVEAEYILLDGEVLDRIIVKPKFKPVVRESQNQQEAFAPGEIQDVPVLPAAVPTQAPTQKTDPAENTAPAIQSDAEFPAVVAIHPETDNSASPVINKTQAEIIVPILDVEKDKADEATKKADEATKKAPSKLEPPSKVEEVDAAPPAIL
ncbi:MAG: FtsQ-type POTRA domain-containing protein [Proteobacteria bacterium]|nr:FtsQ-type POTRA domain-containing protein [Pseudomonadota bacterium]